MGTRMRPDPPAVGPKVHGGRRQTACFLDLCFTCCGPYVPVRHSKQVTTQVTEP